MTRLHSGPHCHDLEISLTNSLRKRSSRCAAYSHRVRATTRTPSIASTPEDAQGRTYLGRFEVTDSGEIDAVTGTDEPSARSDPIDAYPEGLLAIHDTDDKPTAEQQNYKIVDWRAVMRALGLP